MVQIANPGKVTSAPTPYRTEDRQRRAAQGIRRRTSSQDSQLLGRLNATVACMLQDFSDHVSCERCTHSWWVYLRAKGKRIASAEIHRRVGSIVVVLAALAGLITGCGGVTYRPPVEASAALDPSRAYLYGRFRMKGWGEPLQPRQLSLELTIVSTDERSTDVSIQIKFKRPGTDVYAVAVAPGEYRFSYLVMNLRGALPPPIDRPIDRRPLASLPAPLGTSFTVRAGTAYYVGDYVAVGSVKTYFASPWGSWTDWQWKLDEASLKYDETTAELKGLYPAFRTVVLLPAWAHTP